MITKGMFTSLRGDWKTPAGLLKEIATEFGELYDVSDTHSGVFDALVNDWPSPWYCNPPYGRRMGMWTSRMRFFGKGVALLPARTDTAWFHNDILPYAREIRFIRGRLHFDDKGPAPFPSMLVIFSD